MKNRRAGDFWSGEPTKVSRPRERDHTLELTSADLEPIRELDDEDTRPWQLPRPAERR